MWSNEVSAPSISARGRQPDEIDAAIDGIFAKLGRNWKWITFWLVLLGIVSSLIMPSEAIWRRAAFEMQSPLAGSLPFSPFANVSVPSTAMIGYAGVYLLIALALGIYHFQLRDL